MTRTTPPRTSAVRRRYLAAVTLVAAAALTSACSGSSSPSAEVPGAPVKSGAATGGAAAIEQLIAAEQPADASLMPAGSTAAKIKERGKLLVGGTQTAALFSLLDPTTGKVTGFDAALSQLLAKYITGKPDTQLVQVTAATREALLKNHSVDAVFATYTITPERAKIVNFAGPYFLDGLAVQVKKDNSDITSVKDLAGKTVVTQSASTAATAVKAAVPTAKIQLFDTNIECLQALKQGRADAYVLDQSLLAGNASKNPEVKVLPGTFSQEPYGIGLPIDRPDFKKFVNDWLAKIEADGTWAKVWQATLGTQVPGAVPAPPKIG
ncbi:glutamate ABC transporter substrate-binding protein [Streptomyces sp.]|uniref:glutamate ABC transporter substrate-binding protein n=1 Tax=Streptomyces sp. TaxID=1931 RepID=UPI002F423DB4